MSRMSSASPAANEPARRPLNPPRARATLAITSFQNALANLITEPCPPGGALPTPSRRHPAG